jgi:hypothetical protein
MDRRTYEGPMDWEYQNSGPLDPTSPFAHAAKSNSQNSKLAFTSVAAVAVAVASTINDIRQLFANRYS